MIGRPFMSELPGPMIWGGVPPRNEHFTGRESLLSRLRSALADGHRAPVARLMLYGVGGVGKTQLATEFAHRFADWYDVVWWIPAEQRSQVLRSLHELGRGIGLPVTEDLEQSAGSDVDVLAYTSLRWLLVYDDAGGPDDIAGLVPPAGGHVIVTSRNPAWDDVERAVEVGVFERWESVELLARRGEGIAEEDADRLAAALGDLPLAVDQAASFLAATGFPVAKYLELFEAQLRQLIPEGMAGADPASPAARLFENVAALDWTPAAVIRRTENDAAALEIAYPLACPHGGILWRHVVLLALPPHPDGFGGFPACYYDYANQWNVGVIVVLNDGPFPEDAGRDGIASHLYLVDVRQAQPRMTEAELVGSIRRELDLDCTEAELAANVAAIEAAAGPPAGQTELELLCAWLRVYLDMLGVVEALVADRRSEYPSSVLAGWHAVELTADEPPQVHVDDRLFKAAHRLLRDVAGYVAATRNAHWEPCLEVSRALLTLGLRARFSHHLGDGVTRVLRAGTRLDYRYLGQLVAAGLPDAGLERMTLLFDGIAALQLTDGSVIDALVDLVAGGDRLIVVPALQLLGRLGARRAKPVVEECLSDPADSVRQAARTALAELDRPAFDRAAPGVPLPTEARTEITRTPEFPPRRYFRGPRGTTLSMSMAADDDSFCTVVVHHPDGIREMAVGPPHTLRNIAARLQEGTPPPPERMVGMGEAAIFDQKTGKVRRIRLSDGADITEADRDDE
jgi:hypothetical protein